MISMPEITRWVNNFSHFFGFLFEGLLFFSDIYFFWFFLYAYQGNLFETNNNNENLKEIKDMNVGRKTEMIISAPPRSHLPNVFGGRRWHGGVVLLLSLRPLFHYRVLCCWCRCNFHLAVLFLAVISDKRPGPGHKGPSDVDAGYGGVWRMSGQGWGWQDRHNLHI